MTPCCLVDGEGAYCLRSFVIFWSWYETYGIIWCKNIIHLLVLQDDKNGMLIKLFLSFNTRQWNKSLMQLIPIAVQVVKR